MIGLALALAIPMRAGLLNLGGDGQLVLGGITAAATGLYSPLPAPLTVVARAPRGDGGGRGLRRPRRRVREPVRGAAPGQQSAARVPGDVASPPTWRASR